MMNILLSLIVFLQNLSDLAHDFPERWIWYGFQPYVAIFGDAFWGMLIGVIGAGIYIGTDKNMYITSLFLLAATFVFGGVLAAVGVQPLAGTGFMILCIFFIIIGFGIGNMLYDKLIQTRKEQ